MSSTNKIVEIKLSYDDRPTVFSALWLRAAYTLLAWLVLGYWAEPNSNFFVTLFLFSTPLLIDYFRFEPANSRFRKYVKYAGVVVTSFWLLFSLLGMMEILHLESIGSGANVAVGQNHLLYTVIPSIPLLTVWSVLGTSTFLTIVDAIVFRSKAESEVRKLLEGHLASKSSQG